MIIKKNAIENANKIKITPCLTKFNYVVFVTRVIRSVGVFQPSALKSSGLGVIDQTLVTWVTLNRLT